jgi:hypothetical protein
VDVVVVVGHREVEKRIEKESDNIDVQVMGHFLISSRCQQELISSYLDTEGVRCGDIKAVSCN